MSEEKQRQRADIVPGKGQSPIRLRFDVSGEPETETIFCSHCRLPHPCTKAYLADWQVKANQFGVTIDRIWTCGLCYREWIRQGIEKFELQPSFDLNEMKVACEDHPVPAFPEEAFSGPRQ